jgi:hypothetical protein
MKIVFQERLATDGFKYAGDAEIRRPCAVFLNDRQITDVVAVDTEGGKVLIMVRDTSGKFVLNADRTEVVLAQAEGVVRVEPLVKTEKPVGPPNVRFSTNSVIPRPQ